jgi:hypothetical protein
MDTIALTPQEQLHVDQGGRLLVIEEVPGPLWRVLSVSLRGCEVVHKPHGAEGYDLQREAVLHAQALAAAADDVPLLRRGRYSYEVDFQFHEAHMGWRLRMLQDSAEVESRLYPLAASFRDAEQAFFDAHEAALRAGERWMAARH